MVIGQAFDQSEPSREHERFSGGTAAFIVIKMFNNDNNCIIIIVFILALATGSKEGVCS